ncbi:MAG: hypothetical protein ACJ73S_08755 [Mycobacteriales bacterium]
MLLLVVATLAVVLTACLAALLSGLDRRADLLTAAAALGLIEITVLVKVLGMARLFRPGATAVTTLLVLAAAAAGVAARPAARARLATGVAVARRPLGLCLSPVGVAAWLLLAAVVGTYAVRAWLAVRLPPVAWDTMFYHVLSVATWVRTGSLDRPVSHLTAYHDYWSPRHAYSITPADAYPKDTETVGAFGAVFTHSMWPAMLAPFGFALLLGLAVYGLCVRLDAPRRWALLAAGLVLLTPAVLAQVGTLYVDIARIAAVVAAWQFLLAPGRVRYVLAGACLGLAAGIKTSNLAYVVLALLVVAVLAARAAGAGRRWRAVVPPLLWTGVPALVLGSFWYLRSWYWWGSPVWPVGLGPFSGPVRPTELVDGPGRQWLPPSWQHTSDWVLMVRSWFGAVHKYHGGAPYEETRGGLGLTWLLLLVVVLALVLVAVRVPRHRLPLLAVVLPLLAGSVTTEGRWAARYMIPLVVAGAVALAVLGPAIRPNSLRVGLAGVLAVLALWQAAYLTRTLNFHVSSAQKVPLSQALRLSTKDEETRLRFSTWDDYRQVRDRLPARAAVGYCVTDIPMNTLTLVGPHLDRPMVQLGGCDDAASATAAMRRYGVRYVYAMRDDKDQRFPLYTALRADPGELREVAGFPEGVLYRLPD